MCLKVSLVVDPLHPSNSMYHGSQCASQCTATDFCIIHCFFYHVAIALDNVLSPLLLMVVSPYVSRLVPLFNVCPRLLCVFIVCVFFVHCEVLHPVPHINVY